MFRITAYIAIFFLFFHLTALSFDTPAGLNSALKSASEGEVVELGFTHPGAFNILNRGTDVLQDAGGSLFYSDDPETVEEYGILYQDSLNAGNNRVYLYHVNGLSASAKISAVIHNIGEETANVTITRKSLPAPSTNYCLVGRAAGKLFYDNIAMPQPFTIGAGETVLFDPELDALSVSQNQLVSALYDFTSDQPTRITSLMLPSGADTLEQFASLGFSENDGLGRQGTFPSNSRISPEPYPYKTSDGIKVFEIASNPKYTSYDLPIAGLDAESGEATVLPGNFAVTYTIQVNVTSDDGRSMALLMNPRGGAYGGYFRTTFPLKNHPEGILVPESSLVVANTAEAGIIALIEPASEPQLLTLDFMPAGSSSLPIHILMVPFTPEPVKKCGWVMY